MRKESQERSGIIHASIQFKAEIKEKNEEVGLVLLPLGYESLNLGERKHLHSDWIQPQFRVAQIQNPPDKEND